MELLREELLRGREIALAGGPCARIGERATALGARVESMGPELDEEAGASWARQHAPLHALVFDGRESFGHGGADGLREILEQAWVATRAVAVGALIPEAGPGKVVLVAPAPGAGPLADAARSSIENLARTLSVEWARHGVTTTALAPGDRTTAGELSELICFLLSSAGEYFSGCRLELGGAEGADPG